MAALRAPSELRCFGEMASEFGLFAARERKERKDGTEDALHSLPTTNASASVGLSASIGFSGGSICLL